MQWKKYTSIFSIFGYLLMVWMLPEARHQIVRSFFAGILLGILAWSVIAFIEKRGIGPNNNPVTFITLLLAASILGWAGANYVLNHVWASGYALIALSLGIFPSMRGGVFRGWEAKRDADMNVMK